MSCAMFILLDTSKGHHLHFQLHNATNPPDYQDIFKSEWKKQYILNVWAGEEWSCQ
jgi:hypothetical protein